VGGGDAPVVDLRIVVFEPPRLIGTVVGFVCTIVGL